MSPSDFANADVDELVTQLTTDELISLTAGVGFWKTHEVQRLGIPSVKVSDGPNGIRGNHFFMGTPAKCLPSSTALGATWDTELVEEVGLKLLAPEAKLRAASLVLAPTCNIQRNPLGGRSFESFSEDPYLSGLIAASYVKGVQKGGIGATIKHFVQVAGNDKEDDRMGYDSIMTQRALREVYLMPFMLAQRYAQPWAYMTAYNRVNGVHVSENPSILQKILRDEWQFNGMVMSDWFGIYSIDLSINAGLDLEMPGTNKWRSLDLMNRSIVSRKITTRTLRERARNVLNMVQKCAKGAPEILDGDGIERTVESEEDKVLMRRVAREGIVLLKNDRNVLPLKPKEQNIKHIAILGPNAKATVLSGGGSAALKASYFISPYDGIVQALKEEHPDVQVSFGEGARAYMTMPSLDYELFTSTGEQGWIGSWYSHEEDESMTPLPKPISTGLVDETRIFVSTSAPTGITRIWTLKLEGYLKPRPYDAKFEFGLTVAGRAKLFIDGNLVIDNATRQVRGESFFGCGTAEERGVYQLKANQKHNILVEFCNVRGPADGDEDQSIMDSNPGVRLGGAEVEDPDELMQKAVSAAKEADAVIVIVGLNADWETEGYDRKTLALPGRTDELVEKVAAVNTKTVIVTQSGSSITMPWASSVSTIVHGWYLGNATGDALADVLFGKHNPSGKLSLTFPEREEDIPSFDSFNSENGVVRYAEDLFVGYKHYQMRKIKPLFAFGHGLSYTTFSISSLEIGSPVISSGDLDVSVTVEVTNTGQVLGAQVVQIYTSLPKTSLLTHPKAQLKGFKKVVLNPGEVQQAQVKLDKYAVSYWNEALRRWIVEPGKYNVAVGFSSDEILLEGSFIVGKGFEWNGL
ncbi:beta-glucosidase [Mycena floridula]|nr:beta-glucosidase [Mycena floridula]